MLNSEISNLLKRIFSENWNKLFVSDSTSSRELTYMEFFGATLNCMKEMERIGVKKNNTLCLLMANSLDLMILYFAALVSQIKIVPIDPSNGSEGIREILGQIVGEKYIIASEPISFIDEKVVDIKDIHEGFYEKINAKVDTLTIFDEVDYEELYMTTFTSGSTGVPKGVMHSFKNLALSAMAFSRRMGFGGENVFYHNLPMTHMAGILNLIFMPLISGSRIVIGERFGVSNIMRFWEIPCKYSVNTFWLIPTIVNLLIKIDRGRDGIDFCQKNEIICCVGTAPISFQSKQAFKQKYGLSLSESYGLSETLFVSVDYPQSNGPGNNVGKVLEGVKLSFCEDGEIVINVPWMFLGYSNAGGWNSFKSGEFRSGDMGVLDPAGQISITGRKKELIIKGGINISPKTAEEFIGSFNVFEENAVVGIDDPVLGEKTVCFFVIENEVFINKKKKDLNRNITEKLGGGYRIDEFVQVNSIPKTFNGKIDKPGLKRSYHEGNIGR